MLKILSYFDVFPDFMDILSAFGSKDGPIDEIYSTYNFSTFSDKAHIPGAGQDSFFTECCYLLKYVDLHHRDVEKDRPWSIRHMGIYQKYDFSTQRSIYMFLQPSDHITQLLTETLASNHPDPTMKEDFCVDWTHVHLLCIGAIRDHWRDYINSLDSKVIAMVCSFLAAV